MLVTLLAACRFHILSFVRDLYNAFSLRRPVCCSAALPNRKTGCNNHKVMQLLNLFSTYNSIPHNLTFEAVTPVCLSSAFFFLEDTY